MSRYCPIVDRKVVYLDCLECDDRVCEKGPTPSKPTCKCDTCFNKIGDRTLKLKDVNLPTVMCKLYTNTYLYRHKTDDCKYYNKDMSKAKICLNCKHYIGGGDWGLGCHKDYHRLPNALDEACNDWDERIEEDGKE